MKWPLNTCLALSLFLCGCQKDVPDPEVKKEFAIVPMHTVVANTDVDVAGIANRESFSIQHHTRGNQVYVECMIPSITFTNSKTRLVISVDGQEKKVVNTAAFIIKGLSSGSHRILLQVEENNQKSTELKKEFVVTIP